MDKCENCGFELHEGDALCPSCGWHIPTEEPAAEPVPEVAAEEAVELIAETAEAVPEEGVWISEAPAESAEVPAAEVTPEPKKKKLRWWMIAIAAVLVLVLAVALLWKPLMVRIMPTMVLAKSAANTMEELAGRVEGTPLTAMENAMDEEGKFSMEADVQMTLYDYVDVEMFMTGRYDTLKGQTQATMDCDISMMSYLSLNLDMNTYVDRDFAAVNWKQVTGDNYYGLCYKTFTEDIRSNQALYELIGEENMAKLEESMTKLQDQMELQARIQEGLEYSEAYVHILTEYLTELKPQVTTEKMTIGEYERKCYKLTYTVSDEDLAGLMEAIADVMENDEAAELTFKYYKNAFSDYITSEDYEGFLSEFRDWANTVRESEGSSDLHFYLYEEELVYFAMDYASEDTTGGITLLLGEDPAANDLEFTYFFESDDNEGHLNMVLSTEKDEDTIRETVYLALEDLDTKQEGSYGYEWDRVDGDFLVFVKSDNGKETIDAEIPLIFLAGENGISIVVEDLGAILAAMEAGSASTFKNITCSIDLNIQPGAEITVPEYTNISDVTEGILEDLTEKINNYLG